MKAFRAGLLGCFGVGAAIVIAIIVFAAIGGAGRSGGSGSGSSSSPRPVGTRVLLDLSGNGIKGSPTFRAPDEWTIDYSYDCSGAGGSGNFIISVEGDTSDVAANLIGAKGQDTTTVHGGGNVHLSINSECSWHVTAKG